MRCAPTLVVCLALAAGLSSHVIATERQTAPPPPKPAGTVGDKPRGAASQASRLSLTIMVTARDGRTIEGVAVRATGPADREGRTDDSGLVTLQNLQPGTYRLRFDHEAFISLEKEVNLPAGKPLRVSATLTPAPPPPPPPKPELAPAPPAPTVPDGTYTPSGINIPDFFDSNAVGNSPVKLGCGAHATSTLVQARDVAEHAHADADEVIYIVAGEGTHRVGGRDTPLKAGTFAFVPSGTSHAMSRRGSRPLIFVSTLAGPPCQPGATAAAGKIR
jgi:mannose-6-phosphate isomerase-like protein (cupin superfamily)